MNTPLLNQFEAAALNPDLPLEEFLHQLGGPSVILQPGSHAGRCRALVTLIHGNEPSGLRAVHRWLQSGRRPLVDTLFVIASVKAALEPPSFYYRMLPGFRDLNRCFRPPFDGSEGHLAKAILDVLREFAPLCLVDIHNTSGSGPSFGVAITHDPLHDALVSHFTQRLVITDLRLGALMEISEPTCPTVTIECGGSQDPEADAIAWEGLQRYLIEPDVLKPQPADWELERLINPIRLEVVGQARIAYGDGPVDCADITLPRDIEHRNFGVVPANTHLGWLGERGMNALRALDTQGQDRLHDLYCCEQGSLRLRRPLKLFMITSNPTIARDDCLWYSALIQPR